MSPKSATLSLALLSLTVTLTLSFAAAMGGCKDKLPEILESYDLPAALFPEPAQNKFECTELGDGKVSVKVNLQGKCTVTRTALVVKNVLTWAQEVSATISHKELSDISGITVTLYISIFNHDIPFPYFPEVMTVTGAKVRNDHGVQKLQFFAIEGNSPEFPLKDLPNQPPTCDRRHSILGYFFAADDISNKDVTDNHKYGARPLFPLPIVA